MSCSEDPSSKRIFPRVMLAEGGRIRRIACAVTDLPDPDSPTSARVRPRCTSRDRPCKASNGPVSVRKATARSRIESSGLKQSS
jgi:hypothetical protein